MEGGLKATCKIKTQRISSKDGKSDISIFNRIVRLAKEGDEFKADQGAEHPEGTCA